jgi:hypothetical protein
MVAVHGGGGRVLRDPDGAKLRVVRLQPAGALPVHPDPARHKVGLNWKKIPVALLDPGHTPLPLEPGEDTLQLVALATFQSEPRKQLSRIKGCVVRAGKDLEDLLFHLQTGTEKGVTSKPALEPGDQRMAAPPPSSSKSAVTFSSGRNNANQHTQRTGRPLSGVIQRRRNNLDGNLLFDGAWSYEWDGENRLIPFPRR